MNKKVILSGEVTTQGDSLAMAMYGLSTLPLIELVSDSSLTQKKYVDDGNAVGNFKSLGRVLHNIIKHGKYFGYHVKASKCQLIVKDEKYNEAIKKFKNNEIEMKKGVRVLGSVIGPETETKTFLETRLEKHNKILKKLGKIAKTSPQNVYSCYTKGLQENLSFLARTNPIITENMYACEKMLQENHFPNLIGKDNISHQFRDIASLPLKLGGLNINLFSSYENFLEWSFKTSSVLDTYGPLTAISEQEKIFTKIKILKTERTNQKRTNVLNNLSDNEKYEFELASEKGASNCLNALPLSRYNFNLNKTENRYMCLRSIF